MDPFRVLGLHPSASQAEVKAAYRKHALQHHPDQHINSPPELRRAAEATFKQATAAYEQIVKDGFRPGRDASGRRPGSSPFSDKFYRAAYESSTYGSSQAYARPRRAPASASARLVAEILGHWRAFTSSGSAAVTAALGGLFLGGILFMEPMFAAAWERHNEGKLFRQVAAEVVERRRAAAAAAAAAARARADEEARRAAERRDVAVIAEPVPEAVSPAPKK